MTTDQTNPRQVAPAAEPLALRLNDQLGPEERAKLDALLDHIHEYGTTAEGVLLRAAQLCQAARAAERERCAKKPLTHMQIVMLWGHRSDGPSTPELVSFARLLEKHHGIEA